MTTTALDIEIDMPRSLHYKLSVLAHEESVPMDLLVNNLLVEGVTRHKIIAERQATQRLALLELKGDGWQARKFEFTPKRTKWEPPTTIISPVKKDWKKSTNSERRSAN